MSDRGELKLGVEVGWGWVDGGWWRWSWWWMSGGWEVDGWLVVVELDGWMGGGEEMQSNLRTGVQAPPLALKERGVKRGNFILLKIKNDFFLLKS